MHERSLLSSPLTFSSVDLFVDCISGVLEIPFFKQGTGFHSDERREKEGKTARGFYS